MGGSGKARGRLDTVGEAATEAIGTAAGAVVAPKTAARRFASRIRSPVAAVLFAALGLGYLLGQRRVAR